MGIGETVVNWRGLSGLYDHFTIIPVCVKNNQHAWVYTYHPFQLFINMYNELKLKLTSNLLILELILLIQICIRIWRFFKICFFLYDEISRYSNSNRRMCIFPRDFIYQRFTTYEKYIFKISILFLWIGLSFHPF